MLPLVVLLAAAGCESSDRDAPSRPDTLVALPVELRVAATRHDLVLDGVVLEGAWALDSPSVEQVLTLPYASADEQKELCFVGAADTVCALLRAGDEFRIVAQLDETEFPFLVEAVVPQPQAVFTDAWVAVHRGRITVELPEAYELINVVIALTDFAAETPGLTATGTPYAQRVEAYFGDHRDHPVVELLDQRLRAASGLAAYYEYKHNAYALELNDAGVLTPHPVYNRVEGSRNRLVELLPDLQDFVDRSGFAEFMRREASYHEELVRWYEDEAGVSEMLAWLKLHFPDAATWDGYRVVFSPLVGDNQAARGTATPEYAEWQMHVNFPHASQSNFAAEIERGVVLFTELNHGLLDPTTAEWEAEISAALQPLDRWVDTSTQTGYPSAQAVFNEYMNWGLIALWYADRAPADRLPRLLDRLDRTMVVGRGFPRFADFSAFLLAAYRGRPEGVTISDLLPDVIPWFAEPGVEEPARPDTVLSDDWAGWAYLEASGDLPVRAHLASDSVLLDLPHLVRYGLPARWESEDGPLQVHAVLDQTPIVLSLDEPGETTIRGTIQVGVETGELWLHRSALPLDRGGPALRTGCAGTYVFPEGRVITVSARSWGELRYFDSETGRQGTLFALDDSTFFAGAAEYVPTRIHGRARCRAGDVLGRLGWSTHTEEWVWGSAVATKEREVRIPAAGAQLAGTLLLPAGEGPFPAVVTLGGSNWTDRASVRAESEVLLAQGVAVLIFDKRGHGDSSGERVVDFSTLASDAASAASMLRHQPEIRQDAVGVFGRSRGGWYAPIAAATPGAVDFVVLFVASGRSPAEQEMYRRMERMQAHGAAHAELLKARTYLELMYAWVGTGKGWEPYEDALWGLTDAEFAVLGGSDEPGPESWGWDRLNAHFDPFPYWEQVEVPVLAIFGSEDRVVDTSVSLPRIAAALARAGNDDVELVSVPDAGHSLRTPGDGPLHLTVGYAPAVWSTVARWIKRFR
jgi:dienelactone hydrolase